VDSDRRPAKATPGTRFIVAAALALTLSLLAAGCGDSPSSDMACNGHRELCDRPFNQVAFAGSHNAMSNQDDGWLLPNQIHDMPTQLEEGVRVFLIDTHDFQGSSWLCHEFCELGKIPLVDALTEFRVFMDEHPNEVLAFVIENYITNQETEDAFVASGLVKYVYVHPPGTPWPTLREMIRNGTRLLVMAETGHPPPAWYQYAYDLQWDTPYSFASEADFSCKLNRGKVENDLFQINHWLSTPFSMPENGEKVNQFDVLWARVDGCRKETGRFPNFIAVDYVDIGDLFEVVDRLNGF
jgi:hypothetical protein